jgi:Luciferase-like monooxygenase
MARTRPRRLGFSTRLLDQANAGERYRLATDQIVHAERHGFDSAWVAQHHFDGDEGGLHVVARTSRIRLGTGIVTLPLGEPVRVAEDAAVFDLISNGGLELGLGPAARHRLSPASGATARIGRTLSTAIWRLFEPRSPANGSAAETVSTQRRRISSIGSGRRPFQPLGVSGLAKRATD